jgi:hypothetical protein
MKECKWEPGKRRHAEEKGWKRFSCEASIVFRDVLVPIMDTWILPTTDALQIFMSRVFTGVSPHGQKWLKHCPHGSAQSLLPLLARGQTDIPWLKIPTMIGISGVASPHHKVVGVSGPILNHIPSINYSRCGMRSSPWTTKTFLFPGTLPSRNRRQWADLPLNQGQIFNNKAICLKISNKQNKMKPCSK